MMVVIARTSLTRIRLSAFLIFQRSMATNVNHYDILGVGKKATKEEVRKAYYARSKEYHPDHNPNDPSLHDKFVKLQESYAILRSPTKRRDYDLRGFRTHRVEAPETWIIPNDDPLHWEEPAGPGFNAPTGGQTDKTRMANLFVMAVALLTVGGGSLFVMGYVKYVWQARRLALDERDLMGIRRRRDVMSSDYRMENIDRLSNQLEESEED